MPDLPQHELQKLVDLFLGSLLEYEGVDLEKVKWAMSVALTKLEEALKGEV